MNTPFLFRGVLVVGVPYRRSDGNFVYACEACIGNQDNWCAELPSCKDVVFIEQAEEEAWFARLVAAKLTGENRSG